MAAMYLCPSPINGWLVSGTNGDENDDGDDDDDGDGGGDE